MSTKAWTKERREAHAQKIRAALAAKKQSVDGRTSSGIIDLKAAVIRRHEPDQCDQMLGDESMGTIEAITLLIQYRDGSLEAKRVI